MFIVIIRSGGHGRVNRFWRKRIARTAGTEGGHGKNNKNKKRTLFLCGNILVYLQAEVQSAL
jgi:hypothetical protein